MPLPSFHLDPFMTIDPSDGPILPTEGKQTTTGQNHRSPWGCVVDRNLVVIVPDQIQSLQHSIFGCGEQEVAIGIDCHGAYRCAMQASPENLLAARPFQQHYLTSPSRQPHQLLFWMKSDPPRTLRPIAPPRANLIGECIDLDDFPSIGAGDPR